MSFRKRSSKPAVRKKPAADDDVSTLITAEAADDSNSDGVIDPLDFLSVAKMKRIRRRQEMASSRQDQDSSTGKQYLESLTEGGIRYASSQMDEAIRQHPTAALFTSSVAAAAAKKRMEEFVEEELRKKRGGETISEVLDKPLAAVMQSEANILISAAQSKLAGRSAVQRDEGGHSGSDGTQQQPVPSSEATFLADTTKILDKLPDDLKSSGREKRPETGQEGIIQASAALLTAVPEVDLGIEAKLRNYELTEMAIRRMETGRPSSALADRPIGLPVGNWMYGKHQAAAKRKVSDQVQGGSEAADTATDNLVEARFKRVMANRRR